MPTTSSDKPEPQGPSLEEAAHAIEGLLDLQDTEGNQETDDSAADAARTDGESVAAEETSEETTATEETQTEETEASDDTEGTEAADKTPVTITVKIDGKTQTISVEEAANGYQRYADYSRKLNTLAEDRKKFEAEAQAVQEERGTYKTMLVALRDQLQQVQPEEPDWAEVYRTDPVGYARRRDEWRDKQDKIAAAKFELERVQTEERKEQQESARKLAVEKRAEMLELNPAWKDPKVWDADRQAIIKHALANGYSHEEVAAAYDPRAIVMFNKARLYDELMANKPRPAAVKGPKVASAGASRDSATSGKLNAAQQRLAKSGRLEDAAKVFEQII